jgi:hypothetical protein
MKRLIALGLAGALLAPLSVAFAQGYPPPPPPRFERAPYGRPGFIWEPGHWQWDGVRYDWVGGHWLERRPGYAHFEPGHWVRRGGAWVWDPPHWR